jgi:hypothetical protein
MNLRLCLLATLIAALPLSVELPTHPDSLASHSGETRIDAMAGTGEFCLITRGCENEVLSEVRHQATGGALSIEHRFPKDWVVGVRGGTLHTRLQSGNGYLFPFEPRPLTTHYVNPWLAFERTQVGFGGGWIASSERFPFVSEEWKSPLFTGHVRVGGPRLSVALRYMEDVPLQLGSYGQLEIGTSPRPNLELAFGPGILGPFDGATLGIKGRLWVTPEAAAQVRGGIGSHGQFYVAAGATARIPGGGAHPHR